MKATNNYSILKSALAALTAIMLGSSLAHAQATRTWVSGVGDDVNPCSRTAPCKTFAGAISKTAAGGEIDVLDPGGFGTVTITKSITIDGGGGLLASVLASATNGINVNAGANDVVNLRNISINGAGTTLGLNGVNYLAGSEVNIENCVIVNFSQNGVSITPSAGGRCNIKDSVIRSCGGGAVRAAPPASFGAVVNISRTALLASLYGYRGEDRVVAMLDNCNASGNTNNGILGYALSAASATNASNCVVVDNGIFGVVSSGASAIVRISSCTITSNGTGVATQNGAILNSFGNNRIKGNSTDVSGTISPVGQQ